MTARKKSTSDPVFSLTSWLPRISYELSGDYIAESSNECAEPIMLEAEGFAEQMLRRFCEVQSPDDALDYCNEFGFPVHVSSGRLLVTDILSAAASVRWQFLLAQLCRDPRSIAASTDFKLEPVPYSEYRYYFDLRSNISAQMAVSNPFGGSDQLARLYKETYNDTPVQYGLEQLCIMRSPVELFETFFPKNFDRTPSKTPLIRIVPQRVKHWKGVFTTCKLPASPRRTWQLNYEASSGVLFIDEAWAKNRKEAAATIALLSLQRGLSDALQFCAPTFWWQVVQKQSHPVPTVGYNVQTPWEVMHLAIYRYATNTENVLKPCAGCGLPVDMRGRRLDAEYCPESSACRHKGRRKQLRAEKGSS